MASPLNELHHLIKLTQSYIIEEFNKEDSLFTDQETYQFFLEYYQNHKKNTPPLPISPPANKPHPVPTFVQEAPLKVEKIAPPQPKQELPSPSPPLLTPNPSLPPEKERETPQLFNIEEFKTAHTIELSSIKRDIMTLFPKLELLQQLPDDSKAKKIANEWRQTKKLPEVILLSFNENPEEIAFLQKVTQAITNKQCPAALYSAYTIDAQNKWSAMFKMSQLKLILCPDYAIHSCNSLINNFNSKTKTLGGIPVLLLPSLSLYLRQPELKSALWQAICAKIGSK